MNREMLSFLLIRRFLVCLSKRSRSLNREVEMMVEEARQAEVLPAEKGVHRVGVAMEADRAAEVDLEAGMEVSKW